MAFKIDHSNTGFKNITAGEYEVFVTELDLKNSSNGNRMAVFNYTVREDVDQEFQGSKIRFDNFVDTETAHWKINAASKAAGMEHGVEYDSFDDWARAFKGRSLKVVIVIEPNNQGKEYPVVKQYKESTVGGFAPEKAAQDPFQNDNGPINISDEDLPF